MLPFPLPLKLGGLSKGEKLSLLGMTIVAILALRFTVQLYQARIKFKRLQSQGIVRLLSCRKES